jgi:hypothetical protein
MELHHLGAGAVRIDQVELPFGVEPDLMRACLFLEAIAVP